MKRIVDVRMHCKVLQITSMWILVVAIRACAAKAFAPCASMILAFVCSYMHWGSYRYGSYLWMQDITAAWVTVLVQFVWFLQRGVFSAPVGKVMALFALVGGGAYYLATTFPVPHDQGLWWHVLFRYCIFMASFLGHMGGTLHRDTGLLITVLTVVYYADIWWMVQGGCGVSAWIPIVYGMVVFLG